MPCLYLKHKSAPSRGEVDHRQGNAMEKKLQILGVQKGKSLHWQKIAVLNDWICWYKLPVMYKKYPHWAAAMCHCPAVNVLKPAWPGRQMLTLFLDAVQTSCVLSTVWECWWATKLRNPNSQIQDKTHRTEELRGVYPVGLPASEIPVSVEDCSIHLLFLSWLLLSLNEITC